MDPPTPWRRPLYQATEQSASLLYYVFGKFPAQIAPSRSAYRLSDDISDHEINPLPADHPQTLAVLAQPLFAEALRHTTPNLQRAVARAPTCLRVHTDLPDPDSLVYLRDAMGLLAYLCDQGAVAVLDAFRLKWWVPGEFRRVLFTPDEPNPTEQTLLLRTDDDDGLWLHTRGMRKFARPDVSARRIPPRFKDAFVEALTGLVQVMAGGVVVPEGHPLTWAALPPDVTCHHQGSLDDPDFHNVHLELRWPEPGAF